MRPGQPAAGREARVRRFTGLAKLAGLVLAAAGMLAGLSACASPSYRYIADSDHDLVLRVPHSWSAVNTHDALKATGVDPATVSGWAVFYDASAKPGVDHLKTQSASDPMLFAQTIDVAKDQRASVTIDQLRELMLPATAEERATAQAAHQFAVLQDKTLTSSKEQGVHLLYTLQVGTVTEYFDRIALTDPKHIAVHVVFVHCSAQCYNARKSEIDNVVSSLTLKTAH